MSDSALTMSLADIIKKGKQNKSQKPGRGGAKPAFRFNAKKQNFQGKARGRSGTVAGRGRARPNRNNVTQRGVPAYRGKGSIRGRNRTSAGRATGGGKQQFRRTNIRNNVNSPRKGQSGDTSRLVQRAQRFTSGNQSSTRYFNKSPRNVWKARGNLPKPAARTRVVSKRVKTEATIPNRGKRTIQKFAQKRVQRARLVLSNRNPMVRNQNRGVQKGVTAVQQGIRRGKFGFVTVRSKTEKRIEQLSIQQKISRASQARNRKVTGSQRWQEKSPAVRTVASNKTRRSRPQVSMSNNLVQVRIPNDFRPQFEVQNMQSHQPINMYPGGSSYGANTYNSYDNNMGSGMHDMMWPSQQHRTPNVRQGYADPHEFDMDRATLDPEIQRRISFIQSRTVGHNPSVLPDFKAPVSTSRMKLSDRFRMIMH